MSITEAPKYITEANKSQEEINEVKNNTSLELKLLKEDITFSDFLNNLMTKNNFDKNSIKIVLDDPYGAGNIVSSIEENKNNINERLKDFFQINNEKTQVS